MEDAANDDSDFEDYEETDTPTDGTSKRVTLNICSFSGIPTNKLGNPHFFMNFIHIPYRLGQDS